MSKIRLGNWLWRKIKQHFTPSYFLQIIFPTDKYHNELHYHSLPSVYGELSVYFEWPYLGRNYSKKYYSLRY
jgi:hypothetical protein